MGPWIAITVAGSMLLMLVAGVYAMYETRGFWGLESNSNAATLNTTFNTLSDATGLFPVIMVVVILILAIIVLSCTKRAF